ncbi:MAG TPA: GlsB/YeaQ/YmgE family stress response membrane protein [Candidatus Dormibacteraeota bacterium]|nr:GlsB/YeaQ/YmgE family stress response membrane protein [Candidatus Dormibacteraeota bacterium]
MINVVLWTVAGVVAGILAGKVLSAHGFGVMMDVAAGVIGAFLGGYAAGLMGVAAGSLALQVIVALLGSLFLLVMMKAIGFGRGRTPYVY